MPAPPARWMSVVFVSGRVVVYAQDALPTTRAAEWIHNLPLELSPTRRRPN